MQACCRLPSIFCVSLNIHLGRKRNPSNISQGLPSLAAVRSYIKSHGINITSVLLPRLRPNDRRGWMLLVHSPELASWH